MMNRIEAANKTDEIYKRTYHGSLVLLTLLFIIFLFKTSFCSGTQNDFIFDEDSIRQSDVLEIKHEEKPDDMTAAAPPFSKKRSQKNIINDLTVNKKLVNINTASVDELTGLKGIGKVTAGRIVKYRNEFGNFSSTEDLMKVKGIGKNKYTAIKEEIILK